MKIKMILAALTFIAPVVLLARSDEAMLLGGKSHSQIGAAGPITFSGQAMACVPGTEGMNVSAATISFDQARHILVCTGGVTVTSGGHTIQADKLTITVKADKVYLLNPDGIKVVTAPAATMRDEHSLFIPAANWKPDRGTTALLQSAAQENRDLLDSGATSAALTLPAAK